MQEKFKSIPLTQMRKIIAARMTETVRLIPHFRLVRDIEVDPLLNLRRDLQQVQPDRKLSLNDLLIKACALALQDQPALNIQWGETEIRQYDSSDISVVMAVEGGLTTPIIRNANEKSVWEISREVRELSARAHNRALKMNEVVGGTFSISNLGMYGVDRFDAIINPPQCAILAVGAVKPVAVTTESGELMVRKVATVTLSCDHRAIDGAVGARFLNALYDRTQNPAPWASEQ